MIRELESGAEQRSAPSSTRARLPLGWTPAWWALLVGCASLLTVVDATLLQMGGYFSTGFQIEHPLTSWTEVAAFVAASLLVDTFAILACWALVLPLLARVRLQSRQRWALAGLLAVGPAIGFSVVRFRLQRFIGDMVDLEVLLAIAGGSPREMFMQGRAHLYPLAVGLALAATGSVTALWALGRRQAEPAGDALAPPPRRGLGAVLGLAALLSFAVLPAVCLDEGPVGYGLRWKASGTVTAFLIDRATDVDGDGHGLLSQPRDPDPFDAAIRPWALDTPGNGVDENGVGGDLPVDYRPAPVLAVEPSPVWPRRPHVLLILLESFRADLLERRVDGREITPFMNHLAAEGARSDHAYVVTPYTIMSRAQLLGGRRDPERGQSTLLHDFRANGYHVAYFSAQDDSFGGSEPLLGLGAVDTLFDARAAADTRASRRTSPGSLFVSGELLNERIASFLASYDATRPLFMYVNFHDTHFPYHHDDVEPILGVEPLRRYEIGPDSGERLWRTYANTGAYVDRQVERLVERFRAAIGGADHAILITADHGESLFEAGFLGHGQALDDAQTRVPFVLWGFGGDWPQPLGLDEVRALVQRNLPLRTGSAPPRPRLVSPPGRSVVQYLPDLERPRVLGLRRLGVAVAYDLVHDRTAYRGADGKRLREPPPQAPELFREMIRAWEVSLHAREGRGGAL